MHSNIRLAWCLVERGLRRLAPAVIGVLVLAGTARAQGDGPKNLPLAPIGMNIVVTMPMWLSGNFTPSQTVFVPGAEVDVFALPLIYVRTFPVAGRFGRVFLVAPLATLDARGTVTHPQGGSYTASAGRNGVMDPVVTLHVGLHGAPALTGPEFVKHAKSFQLVGIGAVSLPVGTYDSDRLINLGTNRWTFRLGAGTVTPLGKATHWESANSVFLFTDNEEPFQAGTRSQDPLWVSENHFTHAFNPKWWGSLDLRYQYGGETTTDGAADGNLTKILGGALTLGHQVSRQFGGYLSYGRVVAKEGDAKEWLVRCQLAYSY